MSELPPGMAIVEDLPPEENRVRQVLWVCKQGHHGITMKGMRVYCPTCCHGESVPAGFACTRCGERG